MRLSSTELLLLAAFGLQLVCLMIFSFDLQRQEWRIYHRIGNYSIGLVAFFTQLEHPGWNFPGPNVLEAQIAAQPADFR